MKIINNMEVMMLISSTKSSKSTKSLRKKSEIRAKANNCYWRAQAKAFVNSFKEIPTKKFFKAALYDLIMVVLVLIIFNASFLVMNLISASAAPYIEQVYSVGGSGLAGDYDQAVQDLAPVMQRVLWFSILTAVVGFLLLVFFISLFYGRAWCVSLKKKFSRVYFRKYLVLNLLWFIFLGIVFLATAIIFKPAIAGLILLVELLLWVYLDPVLRSVFDEKRKLRDNIKAFSRVGKRIHWFLIFLVVIAVVDIILLLLLALVQNVYALFAVLFILITVLWIGWVRNYINSLVGFMKERYKIKL